MAMAIAMATREKVKKKKEPNNTNEVVIRVYEESTITRSRRVSKDSTEKTKLHPSFRAERTKHGYDRRAMLLAHSQQLRRATSEKAEKARKPTNLSRPKTKSKQKGIRLRQPVRISMRSSPTRMPPSSISECRNERVASKKKRTSSGKFSILFLNKMKNAFNQLSCKEIKL